MPAGSLRARIEVGGGGDGAKPFTTNATGVATGLNAAGEDATRLFAVYDNDVGRLVHQRGVEGFERLGAASSALYTVTFDRDISMCAPVVSIHAESGGIPGGAYAVTRQVGDPDEVQVSVLRTRDVSIIAGSWSLAVFC